MQHVAHEYHVEEADAHTASGALSGGLHAERKVYACQRSWEPPKAAAQSCGYSCTMFWSAYMCFL